MSFTMTNKDLGLIRAALSYTIECARQGGLDGEEPTEDGVKFIEETYQDILDRLPKVDEPEE